MSLFQISSNIEKFWLLRVLVKNDFIAKQKNNASQFAKCNCEMQKADENESQNIDLPDSICHNRYGHSDPHYSDYIDLCAAGKTGLV